MGKGFESLISYISKHRNFLLNAALQQSYFSFTQLLPFFFVLKEPILELP